MTDGNFILVTKFIAKQTHFGNDTEVNKNDRLLKNLRQLWEGCPSVKLRRALASSYPTLFTEAQAPSVSESSPLSAENKPLAQEEEAPSSCETSPLSVQDKPLTQQREGSSRDIGDNRDIGEIKDTPLPPKGEPDASASDVSASGDGDEHVELVGEGPATEPEQETKPSMPSRRKDDFVAWYQAYPRKKDRDDAVKAWDAACRAKRLPPLVFLLDTLAWQKESFDWTKDGGKWIPYPGKYLRAGSWQDERPARQPPRRYYGPDANGRTPYVREDEQDFENVPRDANGGVDWAQVMGGAK